MASIKELKDCPHGCARTSRSIEVYSDRYVRCGQCDGHGPDSRVLIPRRWISDSVCRQAAMHLWNCRSSANMAALREALGNGNDPRPYLKSLDGENRASATGGRWAEAKFTATDFVAGVEYWIAPAKEVEGVPYVTATGEHGGKVTLPAKNFAAE